MIAESMELRVPVVATRGGGTDEMLPDGDLCGIKVSPYRPDEVAQAVTVLFEHDAERDAMVRRACESVHEKPALAGYFEENVALCAELLG